MSDEEGGELSSIIEYDPHAFAVAAIDGEGAASSDLMYKTVAIRTATAIRWAVRGPEQGGSAIPDLIHLSILSECAEEEMMNLIGDAGTPFDDDNLVKEMKDGKGARKYRVIMAATGEDRTQS